MTHTTCTDQHEIHRRIAEKAGLRYVSDEQAGFTRRRRGRGFAILDSHGEKVGEAQREWIDALAIPPAWTEVWICPDKRGHLQATGRDQRGRKQYRYHPDWQKAVHQDKFVDLADFGESLSTLRKQVDSDLRRRKPCSVRTTALAVSLIDRTGIRVGAKEYARDNETHGLTTLEKHHAKVHSTFVQFTYVGKSQKLRDLRVTSRRIARHLSRLKEAPGPTLMRYQNHGRWIDLQNDQVNDYLKSHVAERVTAKRFRTWQGSVVAFVEMQRRLRDGKSQKASANAAVRRAAKVLGNTTTVCRNHYIHPAVLQLNIEALDLEAKVAGCESKITTRQLSLESEPLLIDYLRSVA